MTYSSIQQHIKSILLKMWDKKYVGIHLVRPFCLVWGIGLEEQWGTVSRRSVSRPESPGDRRALLCCWRCCWLVSVTVVPRTGPCLAHSRPTLSAGGEGGLTLPFSICFIPAVNETAATPVAHHLTSRVWRKSEAPKGGFSSEEDLRAVAGTKLYLWRFQKHWCRGPHRRRSSLHTSLCFTLWGEVEK